MLKNNAKFVFHRVELTDVLSSQTIFKKKDQHAGGKLLIHGTKHRKDNQLQSVEIPRRISLKRI